MVVVQRVPVPGMDVVHVVPVLDGVVAASGAVFVLLDRMVCFVRSGFGHGFLISAVDSGSLSRGSTDVHGKARPERNPRSATCLLPLGC
jgi:hypothetical protein